MSMQMGACLRKEQIGTLFVWVGALEGGFGGGGASGVSTPKSIRVMCRSKNINPPVCGEYNIMWNSAYYDNVI